MTLKIDFLNQSLEIITHTEEPKVHPLNEWAWNVIKEAQVANWITEVKPDCVILRLA